MRTKEVMELSEEMFRLFFDDDNVSLYSREEILTALGVLVINISATAGEPFEVLDNFFRQILEWKNDGTFENTINTLQKQMQELENG